MPSVIIPLPTGISCQIVIQSQTDTTQIKIVCIYHSAESIVTPKISFAKIAKIDAKFLWLQGNIICGMMFASHQIFISIHCFAFVCWCFSLSYSYFNSSFVIFCANNKQYFSFPFLSPPPPHHPPPANWNMCFILFDGITRESRACYAIYCICFG